jgi:hypothetical protein
MRWISAAVISPGGFWALALGVVVAGFLPNTDAGLLAWSLNFSTLISAGAVSYGLTTAQATAYATLYTAYGTALAACDKAIRTKSAVSTKNVAKANLKTDARLLANLVNGTSTVTNAQKLSLGLNVRSTPSPVPVPSAAPGLDVLSVSVWTVKIKLHDSSSSAKRGKPPGVTGASVFSFVGAAAPSDIGSWQFEGNTGRTTIDVAFPNSTAAGAKVWLTAFWFNGRKQSGPACAPVSTNLQGGSVSMAAWAEMMNDEWWMMNGRNSNLRSLLIVLLLPFIIHRSDFIVSSTCFYFPESSAT